MPWTISWWLADECLAKNIQEIVTSCPNTGSQWIMKVNNGPLVNIVMICDDYFPIVTGLTQAPRCIDHWMFPCTKCQSPAGWNDDIFTLGDPELHGLTCNWEGFSHPKISNFNGNEFDLMVERFERNNKKMHSTKKTRKNQSLGAFLYLKSFSSWWFQPIWEILVKWDHFP